MDGTILVADDDAAVRKVLSRALTGAGCRVHATANLSTLTRWVCEEKGDLVITDVIMPDGDGIENLTNLKRLNPRLPVIVISAQNTIMTAIKAEEADAYAYLPKPFDLPELLGRVRSALRNNKRRKAAEPQTVFEEELPIIGRAPAMQTMYQLLAKTMNSDLSMQIIGETGTGKSLIAHVVHSCSERRRRPFVVIDPLQAEDPTVLERLLTNARDGTVVVEQVEEFSAGGQSNLIKELDRLDRCAPRLLSTTQIELSAAMQSVEFRSDLYFRLCGVLIEVPPLRRRIEDIPLLAEAFLREKHTTLNPCHLGSQLPADIAGYGWPGNVRELKNAVTQTSLTNSAAEMTWNDVAISLRLNPQIDSAGGEAAGRVFSDRLHDEIQQYFSRYGDRLPPPGLYARIMREVQKPLLSAALNSVSGNHSKCAELLGINRNTLRKRLQEMDICDSRMSAEKFR